jgi:Bacterial PH domain
VQGSVPVEKEFSDLPIEGETIQHAYKLFRDLIVFTNFRLFLVDKQGMTSKKREYTCVP